MNKYIQDTMRNNMRCLTTGLSRPQKKALHELTRGLLTKHTPVLRHLAQNEEIGSKRQAEKYSMHLKHIDIQEAVLSSVWKHILPTVQADTIIAYDLTDVAKEHAEKMEGLHRIRDGSRQLLCNGLELHGIGINNQLGYFGVHPHEEETIPSARKKLIARFSQLLGGMGIWVLDRGNDAKEFFHDLHHELNVRFVCRVRTNRKVILTKTGALESIKNLAPGRYEIQFLDRHNYHVRSTVFLLIISKHLEDKEPIRLITNLDGAHYTDKKIVEMYLERWGVENLFRRIKQKFQIEKIRLHSLQSVKNLLALIQFTMVMCTKIFRQIQERTTFLIAGLLLCYKAFLRLKHLTFSVDSFLTYLSYTLKPLHSKTYHPTNQLPLFSSEVLLKMVPI